MHDMALSSLHAAAAAAASAICSRRYLCLYHWSIPLQLLFLFSRLFSLFFVYHICVCMCVSSVCVCVCSCIHLYLHINDFVCVCVYTYIYIYILMILISQYNFRSNVMIHLQINVILRD